MEKKYLRLQELLILIPVDRATIWRWRKTKGFPEPIRFGGKLMMWDYDEVIQWIEQHKSSVPWVCARVALNPDDESQEPDHKPVYVKRGRKPTVGRR